MAEKKKENDDTPDWAIKRGEPVKRCRRCWTKLTLYETEVGEFRLWCYNCQAPYVQPTDTPD